MPLKDSQISAAKDVFKLWDEDAEERMDAFQMPTAARALGCKLTQAQAWKACGQEYKPGDKKITVEEFLPCYEAMTAEKAPGGYYDYLEGFRVFDQETSGKIMAAEIKHCLMALGERLTADQVDEIINDVANPDDDGMVKYEDFIKKVINGPFPEED